MTQERKRIRAELQALIVAETDPAKWIAMKDFVEALDDVDNLERAKGAEPVGQSIDWVGLLPAAV